MLHHTQLVPAELPPPKRRLTSVKPDRVRYRGKAYKKLAPSDRTLASERAKLLPLTPRAAKSPELQRIGTSSVYGRGDVKRSAQSSIVRFIGGNKGFGWRKRAPKRGWNRVETLDQALAAARAVNGAAVECHSRRTVGAPLETSYWFRAVKAKEAKRPADAGKAQAPDSTGSKPNAEQARRAYAPTVLPTPKRATGLL